MGEFLCTKWDASDWTVGMKRDWQYHMFNLGYSWVFSGEVYKNLDAKGYFVTKSGLLGCLLNNEGFSVGFADYIERIY